jgi:RHS repeat-associated protein
VTTSTDTEPRAGKTFSVDAPHVTSPTGGGAVRGIGEKFSANPVTGTASFTVPVAVSPGRSGFTPTLNLSYDSGSGNGPYGFGWTLNLPAITRKTERGLPRYQDAADSDVFIMSGSEDLVPAFTSDGRPHEDSATVPGYAIYRYHPRTESGFARIERWVRDDGDVHWRSVTRDNVLTIYGATAAARIADTPADSTQPPRIFQWLISETRDDRGNAIVYEYKPEDGANALLGAAHERNRGAADDASRTANRYLKRVLYGNRTPLLDSATGGRPMQPTDPGGTDWLFELVLDYGEHNEQIPTPREEQPWSLRQDAFSTYRPGFEVRTARLCRRFLMFHHFPGEDGVGDDCLVQSTELDYGAANNGFTILNSVTKSGHIRRDAGYLTQRMPPVEFEYTAATVQDTLEQVEPDGLRYLPIGLDGATYRLLDLHGEGVAGVLTEQADSWLYQRNISPISNFPVEFAPPEMVGANPVARGGAQFLDVAGSGRLDLVNFGGADPGFYAQDADEGWSAFRPFTALPNRDVLAPNARLVDLTGDGLADILITEHATEILWHASLGEQGFAPTEHVAQALDEEAGPRVVFAADGEAIHLADMSGDGLIDLVRIRNTEICYWPNLGYSRFGAKITMDTAPDFAGFDVSDLFDSRRVRLVDVDGSGTTDVIYLGHDRTRVYFNLSGNAWSAPTTLQSFPPVDNAASVSAADLHANGTACLVWSSPLTAEAGRQLRYLDLMGPDKPHLLTKITNNLGSEIDITYASSVKFYLADQRAGRDWATTLPFPVHVIERVETHDVIGGNHTATVYAYHHGFYDGVEREFRGFGMVEQWDGIPAGPSSSDIPTTVPSLTRTWYHTGAYGEDADALEAHYAASYWPGDPDLRLADSLIPTGPTPEDRREAVRALKGSILRQEISGTDSEIPYTVTERNYAVQLLQPRGDQPHAVCFTRSAETVNAHYERRTYTVEDQPVTDPRVTHELVIDCDAYGNVLTGATVAYGRRHPDAGIDDALDAATRAAIRLTQTTLQATVTASAFTNAVDTATDYRLPLPAEVRTFELRGLAPAGTALCAIDEVRDAFAAAPVLPYETTPEDGASCRLVEHTRMLYRSDDLAGPLPPGKMQAKGLVHESYRLAFTAGLLADTYTREGVSLLTESLTDLAAEGGYIQDSGDWWIPSGRLLYSPAPTDTAELELGHATRHFYTVCRHVDQFAGVAVARYDDYDLLVIDSIDQSGLRMSAGERAAAPTSAAEALTPRLDYRVLASAVTSDANRNRTEVAYDAMGLVIATARRGKPEEQLGDGLTGVVVDMDPAAYFADPIGTGPAVLGAATTRYLIDVNAYYRSRDQPAPAPVAMALLRRETHADTATAIHHQITYSDGFAREIQVKTQAEADTAGPRWVGTGWTRFNHKGLPVRKYEPFFSTTHQFEGEILSGVSNLVVYDTPGREVAVLAPDGTYTKMVFDPWRHDAWDGNDTILLDPRTDPDISALLTEYFAAHPGWPSWHQQRIDGVFGPQQKVAAVEAAEHAATPGSGYADVLGRVVVTIAHLRSQPADSATAVDELHPVLDTLDIEGARLRSTDARGIVTLETSFDVAGRAISTRSPDTGTHCFIPDVEGVPIRRWDSLGFTTRHVYDAVRRPTQLWVTAPNGAPPQLLSLTVYGDQYGADADDNLRGRARYSFDGSGLLTAERHDFTGNLLATIRQLPKSVDTSPDWSVLATTAAADIVTAAQATLDDEQFSASATYDALNRPTAQVLPDGTVLVPGYDAAGLLASLSARLPGSGSDTAYVSAVDYDASGRRLRIAYGNGISTTQAYDPLTFRLQSATTSRGGEALQDIEYTYDPSGNVVDIADHAQETLFFAGQVITADTHYVLDSLYRLIQASGREHASLGAQPDGADPPRRPIPHPNDGQAVRGYVETYQYDPAGNITTMAHAAGPTGSWTRHYSYAPDSNRLLSHSLPDNPTGAAFTHDDHGNITAMPHLAAIGYDHHDQMTSVDLGGGGTALYAYDDGGTRRQRLIRHQGAITEQFIYLPFYEIYRKWANGSVTFERRSVHLLDGDRRVALIETVTVDEAGIEGVGSRRHRYQLDDQIRCARIEVDETAAIISAEEYHPYGTTSLWLADPSVDVNPKRYRYTGKERDTETGLYYYGARYYIPWLGRWTSYDPDAHRPGESTYMYVQGNPIRFLDPDGADCKQAQDQKIPFWS